MFVEQTNARRVQCTPTDPVVTQNLVNHAKQFAGMFCDVDDHCRGTNR